MTINSATRKAGPFLGDGIATVFPFTFKVFTKNDVQVTLTNANGTEAALVLDSDYSVTVNADQTVSPGGTIAYPISGSPMAAGYKLTLTGGLPNLQGTSLPNNGPWYPSVIEESLDYSTILIQQLKEVTDRSIKISVSDTPLTPLPSAPARANTVIGFDALGNVVTIPLPSSVGAGDRIPYTLTAGADFTAGVSTQVTLPRDPGSSGNLEVHFDGVPQEFGEWSVAGTALTFAQPIPAFVTEVWGYIGTTLSTQIPPDSSITDAKVTPGAGIQASKLSFDGVALDAFFRQRNSRVATSIAALRALDKTKFNFAFVTGYYASGDGGGGQYCYDAADTVSTDNGGTVIVAADGGRWKLVHTGLISVKQFGVRGDGVADDFALLQSAVDSSHIGTRLRLPLGQYRVSATWVIKGGITIEGESRDSSVATFGCAVVGDATVSPVVKTVAVSTTACPTLKNFSITRALGGTPGTSLVGLETTATDQQVVEDINIWNHGVGLYVHGQLSPYFHRVNTWKCSGYHVKIETTVEPTFYKCRFGRNGAADIASLGYVNIVGTGVDTVSFERCQLNQSGVSTGVIAQFTNYVNANGIINFVGCHVEGWASGGFAADGGSTRVQRIKIVGSTMHQAIPGLQFFISSAGIFDELIISGSSFDADFTLDSLGDVAISGSMFTGASFLVNGGTGAIAGNVIRNPVTAFGAFSHFTITGNSFPNGFDFSGATGTFAQAGNV